MRTLTTVFFAHIRLEEYRTPIIPAALGGALLAPVLGVIALLVRRDITGPVFFRQELVGPRPPLAYEVDEFNDRVQRRLNIKPGPTEPRQLGGRSDLSWDESIRLDLHYVENWSIFGDLGIMWRTIGVVAKPVGAY